jgi:hypothetical protein
MAIHGARQPEVVAQRAALVFRAEQPTPLQLRHDLVGEFRQPARQPRRHDVETIGAFFFEPLLQLVRNARRRADHLLMAARARDAQIQIADRQVLAPREIE